MARRKRVYSRRRRINYKRIVLLAAAIIILVLLVSKIFKKDSYISKIEDVLNSKITHMAGTISTVSKIDASVYENNGIKYTNRHEGIKKRVTFDGNLPDDADKAEKVKILLESLPKSEKTEVLAELPAKDDGYYWLEADIVTKNKILLFNKENEFNFDIYCDKEDNTVYVKEKYFDEFSKKYNKTKFQGYKATDEFISALETILNSGNSGDGPLSTAE
jgi:hypothetical protein